MGSATINVKGSDSKIHVEFDEKRDVCRITVTCEVPNAEFGKFLAYVSPYTRGNTGGTSQLEAEQIHGRVVRNSLRSHLESMRKDFFEAGKTYTNKEILCEVINRGWETKRERPDEYVRQAIRGLDWIDRVVTRRSAHGRTWVAYKLRDDGPDAVRGLDVALDVDEVEAAT